MTAPAPVLDWKAGDIVILTMPTASSSARVGNPYHDENGNFTDPEHSVDPQRATDAERDAMRQYVADKWASAAPPTEAEVQKTQELVAKYGSQEAESRLRGNSTDRSNARENLYAEAVKATGIACCPYCAIKLEPQGEDVNRVSRDRLYPQSEGGRYTLQNTVATCTPCNSSRQDKSMDTVLAEWGVTPTEQQVAASPISHEMREVATEGGVMGQATAMTLIDGDDELDGMVPHEVTGDLRRRWVIALGYEQVTVDGLLVDPMSVVMKDDGGEP